MTTITADFYRHRLVPSSTSPGSSDESRTWFSGNRRSALAAASTLQSKAYAILAKVAVECAKDNWDGYGATRISAATCNRARTFLDCLPLWMPAPDVVPEADGEVAIEWDVEPNRVFSVSIGANGPLHFAGLFGRDKEVHGVESFNGEISEDILRYIDKLLSQSSTRQAA